MEASNDKGSKRRWKTTKKSQTHSVEEDMALADMKDEAAITQGFTLCPVWQRHCPVTLGEE